MTDSDARSSDADELWARFERELGTAAAALEPNDRAMLAVLYVARDRGVTVKRAREFVVHASGAGAVPSEPTISRHRERLEAVLRAVAPPLDAGADTDAATALRAAIGGQSYPAFCARLRRDYGLLWDALHLQRALYPRPPPDSLRRRGYDRVTALGRGCRGRDRPRRGARAGWDPLACRRSAPVQGRARVRAAAARGAGRVRRSAVATNGW